MKRFLLLPMFPILLIACQQAPSLVQQPKAIGTLEVTFDLDAKTAQVSRASNRSVLTPSEVSFTKPNSLSFLADATTDTNYIGATFGVNNLTNSPITDLTIVAYQQAGNAADTALKSISDFNSTPLTATQLQTFARSVQPTNFPSAVSPLTTNNTLADLQLFQESELISLETAANSAGEINTAGGEYLFPYGFVARGSGTSRTLAANSSNGQVTISIRIPGNNEPSVANARRFVMTFAVFDQPLGTGVKRMSESYEERHGTSSAATRASSFGIAAANIAQLTSSTLGTGILVNGVRTAGSSSDVKRILGERSRQMGTSTDEWWTGVVTDSSENVYATGYVYNASVDGQTPIGGGDVVLTKYNASGVKQWTKQFGTTTEDYATEIAADSSGNVYITGYTDPTDLFTNTNVFITKFNPSGVQQWNQTLSSPVNDFSNGIAVDSSDNVFITGYTVGDIDGVGPGTNAGAGDFYLAKYNSSGTQQWIRQLGSSQDDLAFNVGVDASGNAYVTGYSQSTFDGNANAGGYDLFAIKYNTSGTKQWSKLLGTPQNDQGFGIAVDSSGNSYISGTSGGNFLGNTNASVGSDDLILVKLNSSGTTQWSKQLGTTQNDYPNDVGIDSSGNNIYMSGSVLGAVDGNPYAGDRDIFLVKYNAAGLKQFSRQVGTTLMDHTDDGGMTVGPSGDAYVAGATVGSFGGATNTGGGDFLLLRLNSN
jgi:Beta-propeller repeat